MSLSHEVFSSGTEVADNNLLQTFQPSLMWGVACAVCMKRGSMHDQACSVFAVLEVCLVGGVCICVYSVVCVQSRACVYIVRCVYSEWCVCIVCVCTCAV